ncbi:ATP-binding protein [Azospirillum picis]|uniref:histidine kinase n=1 Tax=Azospirillum picis TaxID=488438 RepID=A0ABU0MI61_9PROT|nr:ATP-binding protein [Azospirillum picis]MBP2299220.1 PAS domain S-box-containing protein [Azospirillum picis]MDQ0533142.1 PAS domain S-box-containing protein [Azospirillum picis]
MFSCCWAALYEIAHLFDISHSASAWYPGPGLTLAFTAAFGPRYLPCVVIGIFCYDNTFSLLDMMSGVRQALVYGGAGLYLHHSIDAPLSRRRHVNVFVAAACGSTLLSAVFAGFMFANYWLNSTFTDILVSFWIGDLAGVLLACPAFLMLFGLLRKPQAAAHLRHWLPRPTPAQYAGALSVAGTAAAAFSIDAAFATNGKAWFIVLFPVTMLALREGFGGAVVGIGVANITVVLLFKALGRAGDPAQLQVLLVMIDVAALLIGAAISEHTDTASELRRSERRQRDIASENRMLAAAVHASPVSVTIIDTAHRRLPLLFVNDAFCALIGYRRDQLRDTDFAGLLASGGALDELHHAIGRREGAFHTMDLVRADGGLLRDRLSLAPIRDGNGPSTAYLLLHEDAAATRERESQEREREKLVALGQLAGGVAHEINNLLHPVINLAKDAEFMWEEGQDARRHLRMIGSCGVKAADIVRKVLSFARQGSGPRLPVDFGEAVLAAVELSRGSLPPSFEITVRNDNASGRILASATEISQIVTNLLINASHATKGRGRALISLDMVAAPPDRAAKGPGAAPWFRLSVTDTGPGMDDAVRARIFEPFFTTKPVGEGTGLGLSVVYGIVKDWGGTIEVETAPDEGTRFLITVPPIGSEA